MCYLHCTVTNSASFSLPLFQFPCSLPLSLPFSPYPTPSTQIIHEINAMEANIAELHGAIEAKQGPMMLAQTRLEFRSKRPNKELVRDSVQYRLVEEVGEISGSVEQLRTHLAESENALKALIRSQLSLEEDIGVKTNTLHIEDQCMALRKQISIASN